MCLLVGSAMLLIIRVGFSVAQHTRFFDPFPFGINLAANLADRLDCDGLSLINQAINCSLD